MQTRARQAELLPRHTCWLKHWSMSPPSGQPLHCSALDEEEGQPAHQKPLRRCDAHLLCCAGGGGGLVAVWAVGVGVGVNGGPGLAARTRCWEAALGSRRSLLPRLEATPLAPDGATAAGRDQRRWHPNPRPLAHMLFFLLFFLPLPQGVQA